MPYLKVMIHAVWATKNREHFLANGIKEKIISHIKYNAKLKGIYIDEINGYHEHLHCLFSLKADLSISNTLKLIKGESSFWLNQSKLLLTHFEWAEEYYASSVSESQLEKVRAYIRNQVAHHSKMNFEEETKSFLEKHRIKSKPKRQ